MSKINNCRDNILTQVTYKYKIPKIQKLNKGGEFLT